MLFDETATRQSLIRMIRSIARDGFSREDLLQEALIHLWLTEIRRPGQTRSWYQQSCRFHLQHYVVSGRSVDSPKRSCGRMSLEDHPMNDMGESEGVPECLLFGEAMQSDISARDLVEVLSSKLPAQSRAVLECLADGLGAREVGRKLKLSHTMVIKHRRRIASLFTRLDQTCGAERLKAG